MASYGSTPLFHMVAITPECQTLKDVEGDKLPAQDITQADLDALRQPFGASGEKVDVVVFAAPQLSIVEMQKLAALCRGRRISANTATLTNNNFTGKIHKVTIEIGELKLGAAEHLELHKATLARKAAE